MVLFTVWLVRDCGASLGKVMCQTEQNQLVQFITKLGHVKSGYETNARLNIASQFRRCGAVVVRLDVLSVP